MKKQRSSLSSSANEIFADARPDSFWGKTPDKLEQRYPLLTPEVVVQWQLAARTLGEKLSQNPRTRLGALIISPQNELLAVGVNNFMKGLVMTPEMLANDALRYASGICAEQGATGALGRNAGLSPVGNIMITPAPPCENCAKAILVGEMAAVVADPRGTGPDFMKRWGARLEIANEVMKKSRPHAPLLLIASRVPEGAKLKLDLGRLPLANVGTGVSFAKPVPYESLLRETPAPRRAPSR